MKPLARHVDLICTETAGELVIQDTLLKETHRLSPLKALVYRHANGQTSVSELTLLARAQFQRAVSKEMVITALDQLGEAGLLVPPQPAAAPAAPAEAAVG